jgi:hypothetical protein
MTLASVTAVGMSLYLMLTPQPAETARWYAQASGIYREKMQQEKDAVLKAEYFRAAEDSLVRAIRSDPFEPDLWQAYVELLAGRAEAADLKTRAEKIHASLAYDAQEENP